MDVVLAFISALLLALGMVLQQKAGLDEPPEGSSAGLLVAMAQRPVWLLGLVCNGLSFAAQFAALAIGSLAVVQPILIFSVVFALPLGARLTGQRVARADVIAAAVVTLGVVGFLLISNPSGGREQAPISAWLVVGAVGAAAVVALVLAARRLSSAGARAAALGTATGVTFGIGAALANVVGHRLDDGVVEIFTSWYLYALIAVGYVSGTLSQMSLQTGALAPAVATQMALDPIVSIILAVTLLQETLHESVAGGIVSTLALAAALVAMAVLAHNKEDDAALVAKLGSGRALAAAAWLQQPFGAKRVSGPD